MVKYVFSKKIVTMRAGALCVLYLAGSSTPYLRARYAPALPTA